MEPSRRCSRLPEHLAVLSGKYLLLFVNLDVPAAGDAARSHAPRDDGGVEVAPPLAGSPSDTAMPSMSSGEVSRRTSTTFSPDLENSTAFSAVKTTLPHARRAKGRPLRLPEPSAPGSRTEDGARRRAARGQASKRASCSVLMPSPTRSTAILSRLGSALSTSSSGA